MNHLEYIRLLVETPISYDEESSKSVFDKHTDTKWDFNAPFENASVNNIKEWIKTARENNILKSSGNIQIGKDGVGRIALVNDNKTIFKYNHSDNNQTEFENKVYKKYDSEYKHIFPVIYKSGKNWQIVEKVESFSAKKFKDVIGCDFQNWDTFSSFVDRVDLIKIARKHKSISDLLHDKNIIPDPEYFDKPQLDDIYASAIEVSKSKTLCEIIELCMKSGISLIDLHENNFGFRGNNLILLDWGFGE